MRLALAALAALLLVRPAHGEPAVLQDLRGVGLTVAVSGQLSPFVPSADLEAHCKARLRAAGVPVDSARRFDPTDAEQWAHADLFLNLTAVKVCDGSFAVFLRLSGSQVLGRFHGEDDWRMTAGEIWSSGRLVVGEQSRIRAIVQGQVDAVLGSFVEEWQAGHPAAVSSSEAAPARP